MAFVVETKQNSNYAPKSDMPQGLHPVVIAKIEDLGMVPVNQMILAKNRAQRQKEGGDPNSVPTSQRTARFTFKNGAKQSITKDYNVSLHKKSGLHALILAITGKVPGDTFDLESLVGAQAQAMVVGKTSEKGTFYTAINTIVAAAPGQNVGGPPKSKAQRQEESAQAQAKAKDTDPLEITDDDIPF